MRSSFRCSVQFFNGIRTPLSVTRRRKLQGTEMPRKSKGSYAISKRARPDATALCIAPAAAVYQQQLNLYWDDECVFSSS